MALDAQAIDNFYEAFDTTTSLNSPSAYVREVTQEHTASPEELMNKLVSEARKDYLFSDMPLIAMHRNEIEQIAPQDNFEGKLKDLFSQKFEKLHDDYNIPMLESPDEHFNNNNENISSFTEFVHSGVDAIHYNRFKQKSTIEHLEEKTFKPAHERDAHLCAMSSGSIEPLNNRLEQITRWDQSSFAITTNLTPEQNFKRIIDHEFSHCYQDKNAAMYRKTERSDETRSDLNSIGQMAQEGYLDRNMIDHIALTRAYEAIFSSPYLDNRSVDHLTSPEIEKLQDVDFSEFPNMSEKEVQDWAIQFNEEHKEQFLTSPELRDVIHGEEDKELHGNKDPDKSLYSRLDDLRAEAFPFVEFNRSLPTPLQIEYIMENAPEDALTLYQRVFLKKFIIDNAHVVQHKDDVILGLREDNHLTKDLKSDIYIPSLQDQEFVKDATYLWDTADTDLNKEWVLEATESNDLTKHLWRENNDDDIYNLTADEREHRLTQYVRAREAEGFKSTSQQSAFEKAYDTQTALIAQAHEYEYVVHELYPDTIPLAIDDNLRYTSELKDGNAGEYDISMSR
tara:strand:+ start:202 stop:1896 length:1695 start_codon:yes stop_codon:yes gene_type:complete